MFLYYIYKIKTIFRLDENGNGLFDVGEPPLSNVTVTLHDANAILIGTTMTDASGLYAFNSDQTTSTMLPLYDYKRVCCIGPIVVVVDLWSIVTNGNRRRCR
jgi:hypothetical protein